MKMTINRDKLILAIKAKQAEIDKEKEADKKRLEDSRKKFVKEYTTALQDHLTDVKAEKFDPRNGPQFRQSHFYWPQPYHSPSKDFSYLIQQLELSEDKVLTLDDKSDYFEFLRK